MESAESGRMMPDSDCPTTVNTNSFSLLANQVAYTVSQLRPC